MKLAFIVGLGILLNLQATAQSDNVYDRLIKMTLRDSVITKQLVRYLKANDLPPIQVTFAQRSFWFAPPDRPADTGNAHQVTIKYISIKGDQAKLTGTMDDRLKIKARFHRTGNRWLFQSRRVHTKGW